jgi:hypothetical protein
MPTNPLPSVPCNARRADKSASVSECLTRMGDILRGRALSLCPTHRHGMLERLLAPLPGDSLDPPIPRYLEAMVPRLLWLATALREHPDPSVPHEEATIDLFRCYGFSGGRASVTQGNLTVLDGKIKVMLAGSPGKPGSNAFVHVKGRGFAAHAAPDWPAATHATATSPWRGRMPSSCSVAAAVTARQHARSGRHRILGPLPHSLRQGPPDLAPPSQPGRHDLLGTGRPTQQSALWVPACAHWAPTMMPSSATRWPGLSLTGLSSHPTRLSVSH